MAAQYETPMEQRLEFSSYLSDRDGNPVDPAQAGVPANFPINIEFLIEFFAKGNRRS
ncbi:hypothetical protein ACFQZE_04930 [Paenibacillus sp. GCM10027627]|uniref:hypothetical protein n=1 Tax=unclassified Paenibacillus TaxID=185978 RepID=UPI00363DA45B